MKMVSVNSIYRQCSLITCQAPFKAFCMHRLINLHYDSSLSAIGFLGGFYSFLFFFWSHHMAMWDLGPPTRIELRPLASESSESQPMDRQEFPLLAIVTLNLQMQKLKQREEVTCPTSHSQKEGS